MGGSLQDAYPDRGQSPERLQAVAEGKKQGKNLTAAPKAAAYVPPNQRGAGGKKIEKQVEGFDADEVILPHTLCSLQRIVAKILPETHRN